MGRMDDLARQRFATLRKERQFTQRQVAEAIGWKQATVSQWERGDFAADLDTLHTLATFYGVPLASVLTVDGPTKPANPELQRLLDVWVKLSDAERAAYLVLMEARATKPRTTPRRRVRTRRLS